MRRKPRKVTWASESDLCQHVMDHFSKHGWSVYAETYGYDIILVSPEGDRYGIEAKLKPNSKVLAQASDHLTGSMCHWVVVLVPGADADFQRLCQRLKLGLLVVPDAGCSSLHWELPASCRRIQKNIKELTALPEVCVVQRAGVPAPRQITKWKLAAVRFCLDHSTIETRTTVAGLTCIDHPVVEFTRKDLVSAGLSPGLWVKSKWITPTRMSDPVKGKRSVQLYQLGPSPGRPDIRYPEIAGAMLAEAARLAA